MRTLLTTAAIIATLMTFSTARSAIAQETDAELLNNIIKWEKSQRGEIPLTKKPVPKAAALVKKANALLVGDPTCGAMTKASALLEKASDTYSNANAVEAGDGTLRTLARRSAWLDELVEQGKCKALPSTPQP